MVLVIFGIIYFRTYTSVRVSETYALSGAANSSYKTFAKGVLKYSRDGVAYVNEKGEEQCQIPMEDRKEVEPVLPVKDTDRKSHGRLCRNCG